MLFNAVLLTLLALIWGSSFILMKIGLREFNPLQLACIRLSVACIVLLPFITTAIYKIRKSHIKWLIAVALLGSGFPAILFATSISKVDSAIAGIINSMVPLFTLLIGVLFFGVKQNFLKYLGVAMGLGGAFILVFYTNEGEMNTHYSFALLAVLATICYGINANIMKMKFNEINPVHLLSMMYLILGIPATIYLLTSGFPSQFNLSESYIRSLSAVVVLAVFGSAGAMLMFIRLIQRTTALFASTVTYLIPVVAVLWGLYDHESIGVTQLLGMLFILTGVYLVNRVSRRAI